jgi:hypothetical protein
MTATLARRGRECAIGIEFDYGTKHWTIEGKGVQEAQGFVGHARGARVFVSARMGIARGDMV